MPRSLPGRTRPRPGRRRRRTAEWARAQAAQAIEDGQLEADRIRERAVYDAGVLRQQHEAERVALEEQRERQRRETEAVLGGRPGAGRTGSRSRPPRGRLPRTSGCARRSPRSRRSRRRRGDSSARWRRSQMGARRTSGVRSRATADRIVQAEKGAQADREAQALAQAKLELAERRMEEQRAEHVAQPSRRVDDRWARSLAALQKGPPGARRGEPAAPPPARPARAQAGAGGRRRGSEAGSR